MVNAAPRLQERIVGRRIAWPLDIACGGAGGDHPIITCPIGADGKARLHTIFERRETIGIRRVVQRQRTGALPSPDARQGLERRKIDRSGRGGWVDRQDVIAHIGEADEGARLLPKLSLAIDQFDPSIGTKKTVWVAPLRFDGQIIAILGQPK